MRRYFRFAPMLVIAFAINPIFIGCTPPAAELAKTSPPPVTVSQPIVRSVVDEDDYEGHIAAIDKIEVRARVRGHLVKINFQDGQLVKEGDVLFEIDPRPYQATLDAAKASVASAAALVELANADYARYRLLYEKRAATKEEMETYAAKQSVARADKQKAEAQVEQAQLDLGFTKVIAPKGDSRSPGPTPPAAEGAAAPDKSKPRILGRIGESKANVGDLINASGGDTLLATIVSVDPMYVYFDVDERALLSYRKTRRKPTDAGAPEPPVKDLKIPISAALEGEDAYPNQGVIDFADNRVNPSTGTIVVRGVLPNPKRILDDGMRARVRVPMGDPYQAVMVTERALGSDQGKKFVYVVNDKNIVERRDVTLGRLINGLQVISDGLKADDWVIVNGIQRVRAGVEVTRQPGPMPGAPAAAAPAKADAPAGKADAKSAEPTTKS